MKIKLLSLLLALAVRAALAQDYASSFHALNLPASPHVAALGGSSITLLESNAAVGWTNPALYANAADRNLTLSFASFAAGTSWMGAHFTKAFGERHTLALGAQYLNYGSTDETDELGNVLGTVSAKDIVAGVGYSYLLSDRWTGGATLKTAVSNLAGYTSTALGVDLGLNYYDEEQDLSLSAALRNVGAQVSAYEGHRTARLPLSLDLGFSQGMAHLPVRVHATLTDLTRWRTSDFVLPAGETSAPGFGRKLLNHFTLGLDILPSESVWLAVGYNFRRAWELKAVESAHMAGLSAGAGLQLERFQLSLSYARFHQAASSLMVSAGYSL